MASASNSYPKMSEREIDTDICVENHLQNGSDVECGIQRDQKLCNETDLSELKSQQFSNNATALDLPVSKQDEQDSCNVINSEKDTETKNQMAVSEQRNLKREDAFVHDDESCTDSPGITSQDDDTADDSEYVDSAGDERIACIEEEYVQRISVLEQRHGELENVLERLTAAVESGLAEHRTKKGDEEVSDNSEKGNEEKASTEEGAATETESEKIERDFSRDLIIDLFLEFQHKIKHFAEDLNGVLHCSEAAIRHARVVQEWATSVQLMFEQLKDERHKILGYIEERERNMLIVKEQFITELEEQGKTLKHLVEDMMSHNELQQQGEDYCKTKVGDSSSKRSTVEKIVDLLLKRRLEEDRSIILNLSKQSKISEMKLFIIHQQSCIQQLQEQNKELRAIIEGLMGPNDLEEEDPCDTDQTGTPPSVTSQEQPLVKEGSPPISLVSDVLYCDRGEYLPGNSTDGDLATVQAYNIGRNCGEIKNGEEIVFDPLSVNYVREQCQHAEESERQAHVGLKSPENSVRDGDEMKNKVKQLSGEQDEDKQPSGEQDEDKQLSGEQDEDKQPSGEQGEVKQPSGEQDEVKQPSGEQNEVKQPSCEQDEDKQPSGEQDEDKQPSDEQDDDKQPSGEQGEVKQPSGEQDEVKQPSGEQNEVKQPSCEQDEDKQPSGEQDEVKQPSGEQNEVKQPSCEQDDDKQPSGEQDEDKQLSGEQNIVDKKRKDSSAGDSVDIGLEKEDSLDQTAAPETVLS